ncbi:MAG: hypothetical protein IKT68_02185 [Clostridia bacterium]|nr:hypothetical protein [Clostridia bacterium]
MKKTLICILLVVMCLSNFAIIANAANKIPVAIAVCSAQGSVGDVVAIDVIISGNSQIGALEVAIPVPTDYLKAVTVDDGNGKKVYCTPGNVPVTDGVPLYYSNGEIQLRNGDYGVKAVVSTIDGLWESGVFCTFYFQIINELPVDGVPLECRIDCISHHEESYRDFDLFTYDGSVVPEGTPVPARPDLSNLATLPKPTPKPNPTPTPTPKPPIASSGEKSVTFGIGSYEGRVGDMASVDVLVSGQSEIGALAWSVSIPTEYLTVTYCIGRRDNKEYITNGLVLNESKALSVSSDATVTLADGSRGIKAAMTTEYGLWESGVLCTFYFKVIKELPADGVPLVLHVDSIAHYDNQCTYNVTTVDGRIMPWGSAKLELPDIAVDPVVPRPSPIPSTKPVAEAHSSGSSAKTDKYKEFLAMLPAEDFGYASEDAASPNLLQELMDAQAPSTDVPQTDLPSNEPIAPNNETLTIGAITQPDSAAQKTNTAPDLGRVNQPDKSSANETSGSHILLIFLVIAAVSVLGGGVSLVVLLRRKKQITKQPVD